MGYNEDSETAFIPNEEIRQELITAVKSSNWNELIGFQEESRKLLMATLAMGAKRVAAQIEKIHHEYTSVIQYHNENSLSSVLTIAYLSAMQYYFKPIRDGYVKDGTLMPKSMATDTQCLTYQVPGGMLSNLLSQLKMMNALDRFDEALVETPKVRKDMGYPPLVTPTSQMVGVQAVQNVLAGERYKNVSKEIKAYCRGEYGHTPAPIDPAIQKKILGEEKPLTGRYADTLPPIFEKTKRELKGIARCDEDVLSYIAFPQLAEKFFEERKAKEENEATYTIEAI